MKRLLYFSGLDNSFMTKWQLSHFIPELRTIGWEIEFFNPFSYSNSEALQTGWRKRVMQKNYAAIMNCHGDSIFNSECRQVIKGLDVPKILLCFDNLQSPFMHKRCYSYFDLVWITSKENENLIRRLGARRIIYQPYASFFVLEPNVSTSGGKDALFVGSPYGGRARYISKLFNDGLELDIRSQSKPTDQDISLADSFDLRNFLDLGKSRIGRDILIGKFLSLFERNVDIYELFRENISLDCDFENVGKAFSQSRIVLNFLELRNTDLLPNPHVKVHLKTFEIAAHGGLQILRRNTELESMFAAEEEVLFYSSYEELREKIAYYKSVDSRVLERMKLAAHKRVMSEHLWSRRFMKVFEEFGL